MGEPATETTETVKDPTAAELRFQKAKGILAPLARDGATDEQMLVKLINEGFQAKESFKMIKSVLEDLGVRMSAKDRYTQVSEILSKNAFAPTEYSEVRDVCVFLASELEATDEKQAMRAVKKYAKENKIELPKRPKGMGPRSGGNSFRARMIKWMIENATQDSKAFTEWLNAEKKTQGQINYYVRNFEVAKEIATALNA